MDMNKIYACDRDANGFVTLIFMLLNSAGNIFLRYIE